MVKVVMPAATRTTPEMINIFFRFMGRRYPPPLPTSYVERGRRGSRFNGPAPRFQAWLAAQRRAHNAALAGIWAQEDEPCGQTVPGGTRRESVPVPQIR